MSVLSAPQAFDVLTVAPDRPVDTGPLRSVGTIDRASRSLLFGLLGKLRDARLTVTDADGSWDFGPADADLSGNVIVRNPALYRRILLGGNLAAGEAWIDGDWDSDDVVSVCRLFVRNDQILNSATPGILKLTKPVRLFHALRRNTRAGSRRNIAAHYDLGNDFYRLFLDDNLMYSSAIYPRTDSTLEEAAWYKNERICEKLGLHPRLHLLEIGTGWGGFALHAARHHGCRVTTTTLSREQFELASQRVRDAELQHLIDVRFEDYRDLQGRFDRIVSIEMIEAVGHEYLPTYFRRVQELLRRDGRALIQGITVPEWSWERHKRSVDFMKRYIFPGCSLITVGAVSQAIAGTDLRWENVEEIGPHYARTLREWRRRFLNRLSEVQALGFDDRFIRMWDFYLASCEAGFEERYTGDVQMLLARPDDRGTSFTPPLAVAG